MTPSSARLIDEPPSIPPDGTGLYIHYPYCQAKCFYCDFNSHVRVRPDHRAYLKALLAELEARAISEPSTIYFGGGTPSLLPVEEMAWFLDQLRSRTNYPASAKEFTVEANPESLTPEFLDLLLDRGVDRISLGVQALDPRTLEFFGRVHTPERAVRAIELLRSRRVPRWNVDLIMGAPCQDESTWKRGVLAIADLEPPHLSLYDLIYEPGTTLSQLKTRGKLDPRPEEDQARLWLWNQRTLRARGFEAYEVSAFAQPGQRCLHNLGYWTNGVYVGIGAGAASFRRGWRSKNVDDPRTYVDRIHHGGRATAFAERLSPAARFVETLMLRLRLREPIDLRSEARRAGLHDNGIPWLQPTLDRLREEALILPRQDLLELTARGRRLADTVIQRLCQAPRPDSAR